MLGRELLPQTTDLKGIGSLSLVPLNVSLFHLFLWNAIHISTFRTLLLQNKERQIIQHEGFKRAGMQNALALFAVSWRKTKFGSTSRGISSVEGKESEHGVMKKKWISIFFFFFPWEVEVFIFYFGITEMTQIVTAFKKNKIIIIPRKVQEEQWAEGLCVWQNQASKVTPIKT